MTLPTASLPCFIKFKGDTGQFSLPDKFTFPFYYQPHPLALLAAEELQYYLTTQTSWQHDFGFGTDFEEQTVGRSESASGKMFGVLVVQTTNGELGYLTGFSGKLADQSCLENFVPPVFDLYEKNSFFLKGQQAINQINEDIETLENASEYLILKDKFQQLSEQALTEIEAFQAEIIKGRKQRKLKRHEAQLTDDQHHINVVNEQLSKDSVFQKNELKYLKLAWQEKIAEVEQELTKLITTIAQLKQRRKTDSNRLQKQLFEHYRFLNQQGVERTLLDIYREIPDRTPPAGSGDCAAPKLLQYAFQQGLIPIALAEFWWGIAPKSAIRQHKNYYAACLGKCQPILEHMLYGMAVDENPMLTNPAIGKTLDIVYQDESILIINKPAEFLSVPGKNISDSVYTRIKAQFPSATGPLIVHRLDMSTSGLMVIALTKRAHKNLQQQFINRGVKKRYVALIDGHLLSETGTIDLPLRVDLNDRPRQLVCNDYGKSAITFYQCIGHEVLNNEQPVTRVHLFPKTGRTHQLRMHCAHKLGLAMPIIGDDLYGKKTNRLHLHAEKLSLDHPITKETMDFEVKADF